MEPLRKLPSMVPPGLLPPPKECAAPRLQHSSWGSASFGTFSKAIYAQHHTEHHRNYEFRTRTLNDCWKAPPELLWKPPGIVPRDAAAHRALCPPSVAQCLGGPRLKARAGHLSDVISKVSDNFLSCLGFRIIQGMTEMICFRKSSLEGWPRSSGTF